MSLTARQATNRPATIPLRDGTEAELSYSFASLALLEERYGSVNGIQTAVDITGGGRAFGPIVELLGAGLIDDGAFVPTVRYRQAADGTRTAESIQYRRASDGKNLASLMDIRRVSDYADALRFGLLQALGDGDADGQGNDGSPETTGSPGQTSSTSALSSSAAVTVLSGV